MHSMFFQTNLIFFLKKNMNRDNFLFIINIVVNFWEERMINTESSEEAFTFEHQLEPIPIFQRRVVIIIIRL